MINFTTKSKLLIAYAIIITLLALFFVFKLIQQNHQTANLILNDNDEEIDLFVDINAKLNLNNLNESLDLYTQLIDSLQNNDLKKMVQNKIDLIRKVLNQPPQVQTIQSKSENEQLNDKVLIDDNDIKAKSQKTIDSLFAVLIDAKEKLVEAKKISANQNNQKVISFNSKSGNKVFYIGDLLYNKANGNGTGIYANTGSMYVGEWKNNLKHGFGQYEWADGVKYEGFFENDTRKGFGKFFWNSGERYEGEWDNDKRNGKGILFDINGNIKFEGDWVNDKPIR